MSKTTIVAAATAMVAQPIGIIRLSGPLSLQIAQRITTKKNIVVRKAHFVSLYDNCTSILDHAVLIYFNAPFSFTGEDVVEFQVHGNPYVKQRIIHLCLEHGAQLARPGEFSERAFHNGKMSLDQVEAVADLIHANSLLAAKSAALSLEGALKQQVVQLQSELMALRVLVEASIDFSEEDIPTINNEALEMRLEGLKQEISDLYRTAQRGVKLQMGIKVALVGAPNVGKSTLMNTICQQDVSIVTHEAGTTRDVICREVVHQGVCITFSDTAGIRETESIAESMGIERSYQAIEGSDLVLHITEEQKQSATLLHATIPLWTVVNKVDIRPIKNKDKGAFYISAKTRDGVTKLLDAVIDHFKLGEHQEAPFSARIRQVDVLKRVIQSLEQTSVSTPSELMAQDLRMMQETLSEITGVVSNDEMLEELFAGFCIGK